MALFVGIVGSRLEVWYNPRFREIVDSNATDPITFFEFV